MNTVSYEFSPGECVYVVLDERRLEEAAILQVDIRIYDVDTSEVPVKDINYIVLLTKDNDSVRVSPSQVFSEIDDALNSIKLGFSEECVDLT